MTNINLAFQTLLRNRQLQFQEVRREDGTIYKGRLSLNDDHIIDFAFWVENSEDSATVQIIFNNLSNVEEWPNRDDLLEKINELNRTHCLYYYLVLDIDNRIFARYVTQITLNNLENLFDIFKTGTRVVKQVVTELSRRNY